MCATRWKSCSVGPNTGGVRIDPERSRWLSRIRVNQFLHEPVPNRRAGREELLAKAAEYTGRSLGLPGPPPPGSAPVIATGHQPVWHHCGIWAKTLACSRAAQAARGTAVHVVLDHDVCATALAIPQSRPDGTWCCRQLPVESGPSDRPLELRRPQATCLERFLRDVTRVCPEQLCNARWGGLDVAEALRSNRIASVADAITYLQALLHTSLDAHTVLYLPVSGLSETDAFRGFVASIISTAMYFSQCYNDAVAQHRHDPAGGLGVRVLTIDSVRGQAELPFWLVPSDGRRVPMHIRHESAGRVCLLAAADEIGLLDTEYPPATAHQLRVLLENSRCLLRPKAITLTLFLRLYLADWFIHGVGGARYEPITDHLVREHYGIKAPPYGVVTCTATLPRCRGGGPLPDGSQLRHRLHHIRYNPEQYLVVPSSPSDAVNRLVRAKQELIARASDPELSRSARRAAWNRISRVNQQLCGHVGRTITDLEKREARARAEKASRAVCQNREYFFGLFPAWRLRQIADAVTFSEVG
jgi:hypothetical protein